MVAVSPSIADVAELRFGLYAKVIPHPRKSSSSGMEKDLNSCNRA
jgi:hypothetical protein